MFLHTGSGAVVDIKDIITIVDIGVYSGVVANVGYKPKAAVITKNKVFFSPMSSKALSRRLKETIDIFCVDDKLKKV